MKFTRDPDPASEDRSRKAYLRFRNVLILVYVAVFGVLFLMLGQAPIEGLLAPVIMLVGIGGALFLLISYMVSLVLAELLYRFRLRIGFIIPLSLLGGPFLTRFFMWLTMNLK